jgi:riboflavin kinase / FMN adenylyltransferase
MKLFWSPEEIAERFPTPILTMGNFDGVHYGHQQIFRRIKERARECGGTAMVLTFDPHPQKILFPEKEFLLINHLNEKIDIIRQIGIEVFICMRFTPAFAAQHPKEFVTSVLVKTLRIHEIYVGYNSRFGQYQQGTPQALTDWGRDLGFSVTIVPPILCNGLPVSSTHIRQLLFDGNVEQAAELLNRPYAVDGEVVHGTQRGSTLLACPTANIDVQHELIPKEGVYVCQTLWRNQRLPGVVNIGTNPTFQSKGRTTVEVHLLDFQQTLYGEQIKVIFLKRLRDEITFSEAQVLKRQIDQDIQAAAAFFRSYTSSVADSVT